MITSTMFGILVWALCTAHGAGSLIRTGSSQTGSVLRWNTVYGLQSIFGTFASGCLGQSGKVPPSQCANFCCDSCKIYFWKLTVRFKIGRATPKLPMQLSLGRLLLHRSPFVSLLSVAFSLLLRLQQYMVPISGIRSSSSLQYSRKAARQVREPARSSQG